MTMIGCLGLSYKCETCHWRVSSRLFIPRRCNVLALLIKWASRAFLTESRLLRISSSGISWTSLIEWPGWLKCSETGVGLSSFAWFYISCNSKNLIQCKKCHSQYIGETKRKLNERFGEHRRSILNHHQLLNPTPVSLHFNQPGHSINDVQLIPLELIRNP